jgi:adenosylhomocysteine nucleosidase
MPEVAIVAALEREVQPLISSWPAVSRTHEGRSFRFFESESAVLVCGGIGAEPARRAAEAVIALYHPALVVSAGFAGALDPALRVAEVIEPRSVVDARDCSRIDTGSGAGVLVSVNVIADQDQKGKLAKSFGAQAVDMEAAAVAKGAVARGVRFAALKAISDDASFTMPAMDRFIDRDGGFRSGRFALHAALRPWLWARVIRLARNSDRAAEALCKALDVPRLMSVLARAGA